jgi:beta-glucosidase
MRNLPGLSREAALAFILVLAATGCTHPVTTPLGGGGNSGGGTGGGNGSGTGGGVVISGTGGEIIIIINKPDGGADAPVGGGTGGTINGAGTGGITGTGTGGAMTTVSCGDATLPADPKRPGNAQTAAFVSQAQTLVQSMTATQQANQMRGTATGTAAAPSTTDIFRTPDDTTAGVKGFLFRDGPRGVNLDAYQYNNGGGVHGKSTVFPVPAARGATFDDDLEFQIGQAMGDEMVAAGQTMLLSPTVNILRHPLWGRSQETYGEDPYLLGKLGTANVAGVQQYVPACAKHFAGNNIEDDRFDLNAQMDQQTLREIYGRHYQMIIQDGGVACVMAAYNAVNGTKSTQNSVLLTQMLRTEFGFQGFVLTDWWAMAGKQNPNLDSGSRNTNASAALSAGLDMEMPWSLNFSVIDSGTTYAAQIKASATRILAQKLRFNVNKIGQAIGLKASTSSFSSPSITNNDSSGHTQLAFQAALESMTLLKNDNNTLPIKRGGAIHTIAVVGAHQTYAAPTSNGQVTGPGINNPGDDFNGGVIDFPTGLRLGDVGSSRVDPDLSKSMGPMAGIMAAAGTGITVTSGNTVAAAQNADFVVVVAGMTPYDEGEEYNLSGDRTSFALDGKQNSGSQNSLITQVAALGKPMVVVLEGGSVIDMPWLSSVPAVVMAWYPGMLGGKAMGQLLFGDANFSGKLPISWPKNLTDLPTFNAGTTTTMDYYLGYRYFDNKGIAPLFPFGYGMSYTTFEYSNLQLLSPTAATPSTCGTVTPGGIVNVQVDIANTGTVAGDEVAMVFVSFPSTTARRPAKELKGFLRVKNITPGTLHRITIPLRISDLSYYDMTSSSWKIESGPVKIMVGSSSANLPLSGTVTVQ